MALNDVNLMNSTVGQDALSSVLNVLEGGFLCFDLCLSQVRLSKLLAFFFFCRFGSSLPAQTKCLF